MPIDEQIEKGQNIMLFIIKNSICIAWIQIKLMVVSFCLYNMKVWESFKISEYFYWIMWQIFSSYAAVKAIDKTILYQVMNSEEDIKTYLMHYNGLQIIWKHYYVFLYYLILMNTFSYGSYLYVVTIKDSLHQYNKQPRIKVI